MSAFKGTPLDIALRDCGIQTVIIVGVTTEIGSSQRFIMLPILDTFLLWLLMLVKQGIKKRVSVQLPALSLWEMPSSQVWKRYA